MIEPAKGICKTAEYDNSVFYKATCHCTEDLHAQDLILSLDEDNVITLSIHSKIFTKYNYTWCDNWIDRFGVWYKSQKLKWKQVVTLIFTDQVDAENEFMFHGEEQIQSYIDALQLGLNKIKQDL